MAAKEEIDPTPLGELVAVTTRYELWATLAWADTKLRYRRTKLGPFWVTISTGLMVLSVGIVYGQIFANPVGMGAAGYMPFFAVGTILWAFISITVMEGCNVFVQAGGLIKALRVPLLVHLYRMLARNIVLIGHNAVILVLLWLVLRWPIGWSALLILPGFALIVLTLLGTVMTLGVLCTRFRDVTQIIGALLQLLFLLTPIIWPPSSLRGSRASLLLDINPLYYMIEVVRAPILGEVISWKVWAVAVAVCAGSLGLGLALYGRFRHRLPYWL